MNRYDIAGRLWAWWLRRWGTDTTGPVFLFAAVTLAGVLLIAAAAYYADAWLT